MRDIDIPANYEDLIQRKPTGQAAAPAPAPSPSPTKEEDDEPNEPLDLGKGSDAPWETVAPPPVGKMGAQLASNSNMALKPDQIGSLDSAPAAGPQSKGSAGPQIPELTADDLAQARNTQRKMLGVGAVGDALANQNSFGNYFLGRMQPHQNVMGNMEAMSNLAGQGVKDKLALQQQAMQAPDRQLVQDAMNKDSDYTKARQAELQATLTMLAKNGAMDPEKAQQLMGNIGNLNGFQAGNILDSIKPVADIMRSQAMLEWNKNKFETGLHNRNQQSAQNAIKGDTVLNTYTQRADGAQKILNLMDAAEKGDVKSNQALLGQLNAEIARLETGSQSPGLGAAEKTEMKSSAAKLHDVLDTLTGGVTNVNLHDKFAQARAMVGDLGRSYIDQMNNRFEMHKAGAMDDQVPVFESKQNQMMQNYRSFAPRGNGGPSRGGLIPTANAAESSGPHGNVIRQNGVTYQWNPQTGKYE